ncbi:MAG: DUF4276 family protein [Bacteroidia bacterium]
MIKIGLVGEDPNDTTSVKLLLLKKFGKSVQFQTLLKNAYGYQLDNPKAIRIMQFQFKDAKCKFIIYIRDLDGFATEKQKVAEKQNWFYQLDKAANNKGILLLNIWELEALILADIETFNRLYKSSIRFKGDPTKQKEPKEFLAYNTRNNQKKYRESDCPEIFEKLSLETVSKNCPYFKEFVSAFDKKLKSNN